MSNDDRKFIRRLNENAKTAEDCMYSLVFAITLLVFIIW